MKTILPILFLPFVIYAGNIPIIFSNDVENYITNLSSNSTLAHRSGLLNSSSTKNDTALINSPEVLSFMDDATPLEKVNRNRQENYEYEIQEKTYENTFIELFQPFAAFAKLTTQYFDSLSSTLVFIPKDDTILNIAAHYHVNSANSKEMLENIAQKTTDLYLTPFVGRLEFDRTDITRQNGSDILGIDVWFRRIFRNGIVLDNVSSIIVSLNGDGEITSLRVHWPKFVKINVTNELVLYPFCKNVALDIISKTPDNIGANSQETISNISINGVARAWHPINIDGKTILSPCLSFQSDFTTASGDHLTRFLSVPVLKKYYIKDK
jgi:hypothetical protein